MVHLILVSLLLFFHSTLVSAVPSPLVPVRTESPRDAFKTFYEAMSVYRQAVESGNDQQQNSSIERAVRVLDLSDVPPLVRNEYGFEAAILLKEVIDRILIVDYQKIPASDQVHKWRLKDTDIVLRKVTEGERKGEYLFSPSTVARVKQFYKLVEKLPYQPGSEGGAFYRSPWIESLFPKSFRFEVLGYFVWQWVFLVITFVLGFVVQKLASHLMKLLRSLSRLSKTQWDDLIVTAISRPFGLVSMATFWFFSVRVINFDGLLLQSLTFVIQVIFSVGIIWIFYQLADLVSQNLASLVSDSEFLIDRELLGLLRKFFRYSVVIFGSLIAIQNLGINVLSLVAGLGLGGLAFALAAKDTAANFFGSLMIFSDRPFRVGDWIQFGVIEGTVEGVGFRSTRVRTFYNSVVTVPNGIVANECIDNLGRRHVRRVKSTLQLTYDTPPEILEGFLEGIKNIIKANEYSKKDYFHVVFNDFGDSGLEILVYFFLQVESWSEELVQRQNVFVEILRLGDRLGVKFAFPTRTLHLESMPGQEQSRKDALDEQSLKNIAREAGPDGKDAKPRGLGIFVPPFREGG